MGMGKQCIFVVETTRKANIDVGYLNEIIHYFYQLNKEIVINFVYMAGKYNYNHTKVVREIKGLQKRFHGRSEIFYVFDKDQHTVYAKDEAFQKDVIQYCRSNGYHLIWFVRNIEHVCLQRIVKSHDKKKEMDRFKRNQMVKMVDPTNLSNANPCKEKTSNILYILDKQLVRKT